MIMNCGLCKFSAPYDEIGIALMAQHLLSEHGISTPALHYDHKKESP